MAVVLMDADNGHIIERRMLETPETTSPIGKHHRYIRGDGITSVKAFKMLASLPRGYKLWNVSPIYILIRFSVAGVFDKK